MVHDMEKSGCGRPDRKDERDSGQSDIKKFIDLASLAEKSSVREDKYQGTSLLVP